MKAQLILLENPIIVTDEEIKEADVYLDEHFRVQKCLYVHEDKVFPCRDYEESSLACSRKIISHNKPIDYNGIDFGIVDVEKLAEESVQEVRPNNADFFVRDVYKEFFIEGFKASQQLNEKKFSEDDIILFSAELIGMYRKGNIKDADDVQKLLRTYSLPKTFDIEIEETPTNIKIIKKI